jgi:hypothetical protein
VQLLWNINITKYGWMRTMVGGYVARNPFEIDIRLSRLQVDFNPRLCMAWTERG